MPGARTSEAKMVLPTILSGISNRAGDVPSNFHCLGSLSFGSFGTSSLDAASATLPNVVLRLLASWVMMLFPTVNSDAGTPHSFAAAVINISRAAAPALRKYSCESRMARLPPVLMAPKMRLRRTCSFTSAYSGLTLLQSHCNSSATSMGKPVKLPWPISERAMRMITVSSGSMTIQCVTSVMSAACADEGWRTPNINAPASAPDCTKN